MLIWPTWCIALVPQMYSIHNAIILVHWEANCHKAGGQTDLLAHLNASARAAVVREKRDRVFGSVCVTCQYSTTNSTQVSVLNLATNPSFPSNIVV